MPQTKRSIAIRLSPAARVLGPLVEDPAGWIVTRRQGITTCGRLVPFGAPVPEAGVTELLESIGWIRGVDRGEYARALETFGEPPTGTLKVGWTFTARTPAPPKKAKKKPAKKRKVA